MSFKESGAGKRSKGRIGGCVEIAEQRTDIARKRLAKQRAEEWGGDRKTRKKGNGRQPSGNAILSDLLFQHGLLSILIVMAQGASLMVAGAIGGLARLVSATGATVATVARETAPIPSPTPLPVPEARRATRRKAPAEDDGSGRSTVAPRPRDPKSNYERMDPMVLLARHIIHDLSPPEARFIGTYGLTRDAAPEAAKFLFGPNATMSDAEMRALRDRLKELVKGGMGEAEAMKTCLPELNAMAAKDAASRADFPKAGTENDGAGPGPGGAARPGDEPDPELPTPKF